MLTKRLGPLFLPFLFLSVFLLVVSCDSDKNAVSLPEASSLTPPEKLRARYDTINGTVYLSWTPVRVSGFKGYAVYRNPKGGVTPVMVSDPLAVDTTFVDRIFIDPDDPSLTDSLDASNYSFEYRIKTMDQDLNQSLFSKSLLVDAPSPTSVRTTLKTTTEGTIDSQASINDTVAFIVQFDNPTRGNDSIAWYVDGVFRLGRKLEGAPRSGFDTLKFALPTLKVFAVRTEIIDVAGSRWNGAAFAEAVVDIPVPDAGADTMVEVGAEVIFQPKATRKFGKVIKYEWDFDGDSVTDYSSDSDAPYVHIYDSANYHVVTLKVTDDDGNTAIDTKYVGVNGKFTGQTQNGMVLIPAGGFFAPGFRYITRPFWMDTSSVLGEEYFSVFQTPLNDTLRARFADPVSSDWEPYVLFCNLKSKRDGLDTVYIYDPSMGDPPGEGILWRSDFTKNGYRFPTEDEWRLAEKAGVLSQVTTWHWAWDHPKFNTSKTATEPRIGVSIDYRGEDETKISGAYHYRVIMKTGAVSRSPAGHGGPPGPAPGKHPGYPKFLKVVRNF